MIRKLLLLLVMAISLGAYGQMTVRKFEPLPNDLTARMRDTSRKSPTDGRTAALIKVVTPESGFTFDGGSFGIVGDVVYKPGEIWVYVPANMQKITIAHDRFGVLRDYYFDVPIESATTYQMVLDPGVGKYATIQTSVPHSPVYLDGDSLGISPVYNAYILYGKHKLSSHNDRMDGSMEINIVNDGDPTALNFTVDMEDQSKYYGKVIIETDPDSEIIMDGVVRGVGQWTTELFQGNYVVETRKVNCDNQRTTFTVVPQTTNNVEATPPTPHKGYLNLFTRPLDVTMKVDGKVQPSVSNMELPVGHHTVALSRKGYYDLEKEYAITHNVTQFDTLNLQHIKYVTDNAFYFGASYVLGSWSGVSATLGGRYQNIDLQVSYMLGLSKSDPVNYYNKASGQFMGRAEYKLSTINAKLGYQIALSPLLGLTPQVGFAAHMLSGTTLTGSVPDEDTKAACASVGARFVYAPLQHFSLMLAPEYDIAVSKGKQFQEIADAAGFSAGGFFCHIGFLFNF